MVKQKRFGVLTATNNGKSAGKLLRLHMKVLKRPRAFWQSQRKADIYRIGHFLYDDATIYTERKKKTFDRAYALIENNE